MAGDNDQFRAKQGDKIDLSKWPTRIKDSYQSERDYENALAKHRAELADLQRRFYAANKHALLVIFQAMDAAGKDGAIQHVMSGINPQGCQVFSFKHPSAMELEHDFLWRCTPCLPERGHITIFNRSYYEEVLIVKVHPEFLKAQNVPNGKTIWADRYQSIRDFEAHLTRSGTRIVKFFLHLSKEEQRQRFIARIDEADKNWKFNPGDLTERGFWNEYQRAYEDCISATSTKESPWFIVPADDKKNARLIISHILRETLSALKPDYPQTTPERRKELAALREQLEKEE